MLVASQGVSVFPEVLHSQKMAIELIITAENEQQYYKSAGQTPSSSYKLHLNCWQ